jgi:hypothetical protein
VLSFRLHPEYKRAIDYWRSADPDKPSRSEAIRCLIAKGLAAANNERKK